LPIDPIEQEDGELVEQYNATYPSLHSGLLIKNRVYSPLQVQRAIGDWMESKIVYFMEESWLQQCTEWESSAWQMLSSLMEYSFTYYESSFDRHSLKTSSACWEQQTIGNDLILMSLSSAIEQFKEADRLVSNQDYLDQIKQLHKDMFDLQRIIHENEVRSPHNINKHTEMEYTLIRLHIMMNYVSTALLDYEADEISTTVERSLKSLKDNNNNTIALEPSQAREWFEEILNRMKRWFSPFQRPYAKDCMLKMLTWIRCIDIKLYPCIDFIKLYIFWVEKLLEVLIFHVQHFQRLERRDMIVNIASDTLQLMTWCADLQWIAELGFKMAKFYPKVCALFDENACTSELEDVYVWLYSKDTKRVLDDAFTDQAARKAIEALSQVFAVSQEGFEANRLKILSIDETVEKLSFVNNNSGEMSFTLIMLHYYIHVFIRGRHRITM
jgi:flagellin-specific chaperone FliS